MRLLLLAFCALGLAGCAARLPGPPGELSPQQTRFDPGTDGNADYWLYLPEGYGARGTEWPLVLFLHGAGERGTDLDLVTKHGPPKLVQVGEDFPFVMIAPQCPTEQWWSTDYLSRLLDEAVDRYAIDPDRVYLTGLSMGGHGTWALAMAEPERFAAIAPVCGWGDPETACALRETPVWAFHGTDDTIVPVEGTTDLIDALKTCDGPAEAKMTLYPGVGHDSWTVTYANPELYTWLLGHTRD